MKDFKKTKIELEADLASRFLFLMLMAYIGYYTRKQNFFDMKFIMTIADIHELILNRIKKVYSLSTA